MPDRLRNSLAASSSTAALGRGKRKFCRVEKVAYELEETEFKDSLGERLDAGSRG